MTILKNCELWYPRLHPKYPNAKYNKDNPTWEVQIRTRSKVQKKEWLEQNLRVVDIVPEEGEPYFLVRLKKRTKNKKGELTKPPEVVNGARQPIEPMSIANGSVGNVRIFQYPSKSGDKDVIATMFTGIQVTKHIVYKGKPFEKEEFGEEETEVVSSPDDDDPPFEDEPPPEGERVF
jgi:hypothetical protein